MSAPVRRILVVFVRNVAHQIVLLRLARRLELATDCLASDQVLAGHVPPGRVSVILPQSWFLTRRVHLVVRDLFRNLDQLNILDRCDSFVRGVGLPMRKNCAELF